MYRLEAHTGFGRPCKSAPFVARCSTGVSPPERTGLTSVASGWTLRPSNVGEAALRRLFLLALTVIVLALAVSPGARTLAPSVKPSLTAAKAAVRNEVADRDPTLRRRKFQSECTRLSDTLYRCWWDARTRAFTRFGETRGFASTRTHPT
jgi:hypothetical protein